MGKYQYALEEIAFYLHQAEEAKRMAKTWLQMGEFTCAAVTEMGISSQHSLRPTTHISMKVLPTIQIGPPISNLHTR